MNFGDDFAPKEEVDPAADFLAHEQSVLGDLEAEIIPASAASAAASAAAPSEDGLSVNAITESGGIELTVPAGSGADSSLTGSFEILGGETSEYPSNNSSSGATATATAERTEPEKLRKWREEQKKRLEEKDREEERKKDELRQQAKKELEDWLRQTEESKAKTKAASRNAEKQAATLENGAIEPGTEWERIAKLCDFNPKPNKSGTDVTRLRSIYLQLKQNPLPLPQPQPK